MSPGERWNAYWHRSGPILDLAVVRLLCVGSQLFLLCFPHALMPFSSYRDFHLLTAISDAEYRPPLLLKALSLGMRPSYDVLVGVLVLTTAATFTALIGWRTRLSCLVAALGGSFMICHHYSYGEKHHTEALTVLTLFVLSACPSGAALSLDSLLRRRRAPDPRSRLQRWVHDRDSGAGWPLRLLRWHFAICYLSAALCKLGGGGLEWANGYTLQFYLLQDGIYWNRPLGIWAGGQHLLAVVAGWGALVVEGLFWLVLIFPRSAWFFVPAAAGMHLGIYLTMNAPFLQYFPLYAVFVPWSRVLDRLLGPVEPGPAPDCIGSDTGVEASSAGGV